MKQKIRSVMLLFVVSLVVIPCFIYGVSSNRSLAASKTDSTEKVLTHIVASPKEVKVPQGSEEKCFKSLIKVEAYYRNIQEPTVVTNYMTNFDAIKDKTGRKRVTIKYTENGCTKKVIVCVTLCKPEEVKPSPSILPSPIPSASPKPVPIMPGAPSEEDINFPYISGYPDETFRPNQAVTREELATMIARLITKNRIPEEANQFKDLAKGRYSTDAINYVVRLGIMRAASKDEFNPKGSISYKEFKEIVDRLAPYIKDKNVQLPEGEGNLTRVQALVAFNKLFKVQCNTVTQGDSFKDVTQQTPYYEDIRCATQPRVQPRS